MRVIFAFVTLVVAARSVNAYPQFQLSLGAERCSACHFSPAGGGLLNDYGRNEAGETISRLGDGRFLHGLWEPPSWLLVGVDLRGATAVKAREGEQELLAFPMQTDLYLRAGGESISFSMTAGLRGGARDPQPPLVERLTSREHYLMYERDSGAYLRAGRFFPVFGLRSQDHTAYVRRYLGFHTLEEPYGIAGGYVDSTSELHVSAFVPRPIDLLGAGVRARGAAGYYERRIFEDTVAIAAQARVAISDTDSRVVAGLVGKRWFSRAGVLLLAELDLQRQAFDDDVGPTRYQLAAYAGATKLVARGWMVGAAIHHWQPDVRLRTTRDAFEVNVQFFPIAHVELHLLVRAQGSGGFDEPGLLTFLQLHYYL